MKSDNDIKNITIDQLAVMVKNGFDATKADLERVRSDLGGRIDRIEHLILTDHRNRIERLEDNVRELKTVHNK